MSMIGQERLSEPVSFPKSDDEWHSFLKSPAMLRKQDGRDHSYHDRVKILLEILDYIDGLKPYNATFKLPDVVGSNRSSLVTDEMMHFIGCWEVPDRFTSNYQNGRKWVNPRYEHAMHYTEAAVVCGCGAIVARESFSEKQKQPAQVQAHADGCHKIHRHEYRAELLRKRRDMIIEMAGLGLNFQMMANRLGYPSSSDTVQKIALSTGLDTIELMKEARRKTARTMLVLSREYDPQDIGRLYGVTRKSVTEIVRKETVGNPQKLYLVRRRNGVTSATANQAPADD